jgi:hypothetical protein
MKKLLFILLITIVATGCKKEKQIEKNLWKKGGEWEIKSFEESYTSASSPEYNDSYLITNGGTIQFEKDGTGNTNYSSELAIYLDDLLYEEYINKEFTYHHTEGSIYLIYADHGGVGYNLDWEKDKMTMSFTEIQEFEDYDENNNPIQITTTYSLKFICEKK